MNNSMTNYQFLQKIISSLVPEWTPTEGTNMVPALKKHFLVISLDTTEYWSKKNRNLPRTSWKARRSVWITADSLLVIELQVLLSAVICKYCGDLNQIHLKLSYNLLWVMLGLLRKSARKHPKQTNERSKHRWLGSVNM